MLESQSALAVELRHHQNDGLFCDPKLWCAASIGKK